MLFLKLQYKRTHVKGELKMQTARLGRVYRSKYVGLFPVDGFESASKQRYNLDGA